MTSPDIHAHILKPQPRRTGTINVKQLNIPDHNASAELSPVTSTDSLSGPSFFRRNASPSRSTTSLAAMQPGQRTRSILNLTSSTLFGIYDATHDEPLATATTTPRGSRAQTPARIDSVVDISAQGTHYKVEAMQERPSARATNDFRYPTRLRASPTARLATVVLRSTVLAGIGIAYGLVIEQLHDARAFAPVEVRLDRANWTYLAFWATVAIVLGHALPSVDRALRSDYAGDHVAVLDGEDGKETMADERSTEKKRLANASAGERSSGARPGLSAERISIVRIVGAFVGIAFAIRRLPWASTLQVSLTLALVNPMIWYLVDRTRGGFFLSVAVAVSGAAILLGVNPAMVPAPPGNVDFHDIGYETLGAGVWISSVLFSGTVCFGNIGRRLVSPSYAK